MIVSALVGGAGGIGGCFSVSEQVVRVWFCVTVALVDGGWGIR